MYFFVRNIFQKYVKLRVDRIKKCLGTLNKKKLPMFEKSLMNIEVLHETMLSFKEMFLLNFWKQPLKGVLKTDRKMPVAESIFKNYNFTKNGCHWRRFSAYFLKLFKKRRTAAS